MDQLVGRCTATSFVSWMLALASHAQPLLADLGSVVAIIAGTLAIAARVKGWIDAARK